MRIMNIFCKQAGRKPFFSLLMVLLVALSIALSEIGYSAWISAQQQQLAVSNTYTTIAIPIQPDLNGLAAEDIGEALQSQVYADWAAQEAPQLTQIDRRCLLSAYIPGSKSLSSSRMDPSEYNIAFDGECYALAVFALHCENVAEQSTEGVLLYDATFCVEEVVCLSDAYDCFPTPDIVHIYSDVREANGATPFEQGKTYLVFGQYQDYRVIRTADEYSQVTTENRYIIPFPEIHSNYYEESAVLEVGQRNSQSYHYLTAEQIPWFSEYQGTVSEFLASDTASVWNEEIIPLCQLNQASVTVILTDSIQSMYSFNAGDTNLLTGRFFTDEEYQEGSNVCIISAAYAEVNNLQLGDTLLLEYYNSGFGEYSNGAVANSMFAGTDPGAYRQRYCMTSDDSVDISKEYTIIGIYTGARFAFGAYQFNADTIFVPKASVPNAEEYETPANSLLNTFVLENGTTEEFEQYMQQQGLGGQFLYFDQDFSSMQESLDVLEVNALRLMMVGIIALLLISVLFLFLNFRRMKSVIRGVRLLGKTPKAVFCEVFTVLAVLEILAIIIGTGMAIVLYDTVTRSILSSTLVLQSESVITASVAAFIFYTLASVIGATIAVSHNLMKANRS